MSALGVSSGVVVQASGWTPTGRTLFLEPLPQSVFGSGDSTPVNSFTGGDGNKSLNVNLSGGSLSVNISGQVVNISGQFVFTSGGGGGTIAGLQSGTMVLVSGGNLAMSGLAAIVSTSGVTSVVVGASGVAALLAESTAQPNLRTSVWNGANEVGVPNAIDNTGPDFSLRTFSQTYALNSAGNFDRMRSAQAASGMAAASGEILAAAITAVSDGVSGVYLPLLQISGALYISEQSGDAMPVESGGTIPVSIVSGSVAALSGLSITGGGNPNISGGVTVSGLVVISGYAQIAGSGTTPFTALSGNILSSGILNAATNISGAWILPTAIMAYDYSGKSFAPLATSVSGGLNLGISVSGDLVSVSGVVSVSGDVVYISGTVGVSSGGVLPVALVSGLYGWDLSGAVTRPLAVLASGSNSLWHVAAFQYKLISGANLTNVQSGASVLHTVTVNAWVSGGQVNIQDSLSGNTGTSVAQLDYTEVGALATNAFAPQSFIYDCFMMSGIVIVTSGAAINVTVTWKSPL